MILGWVAVATASTHLSPPTAGIFRYPLPANGLDHVAAPILAHGGHGQGQAGLVGLSRLYLGASWLTNVLGAFALGAAWLFVLLTATRILRGLHDYPAATHPAPVDRRPAETTPMATPPDDRRPARHKQQDG